MLLHFSGTNMERIFFFLFFCCCIIEAHPLSIDYTILRTNLAWNYGINTVYPVLVNRFVVLASEKFALSFRSVPRSKEKYELGIFMTIHNAEPQMIWSARQIVSEKSRLELDSSSGRIILRDGGSKEVWSAGHNVSSWELKSEGTLLFYDANHRVVWNSMDYPTDVAVVGQNFTKLTAGNASAMFQNGNFTVNASPTLRVCQIPTGGVKAQLRNDPYDLLSVLFIWNSSGLHTGHIYIQGKPYREGIQAFPAYRFIRLSEDASFMLYGLHNGTWVLDHACCSSDDDYVRISFSACAGESKTWLAYIVIILVLLMFCLQLLWIFTSILSQIYSTCFHHLLFRLRSILLAFIICCSISATSIVLYRLIIISLQDQELFDSAFAIYLTILQASTIFLLKWMATSPKIIGTLILLHMLPISCSFIAIVLYLFPQLSLASDDVAYNTRRVSFSLSFSFYPWPVVNTICLLVIRLPGRRCCNPKTRIFLVVLLNIFIVLYCAAVLFYYNPIWYHQPYDFTLTILSLIIMINRFLVSFIFILVSSWAFYIHYIKSMLYIHCINSILATMQSFKKSTQLTIKRILLWLLLGRRRSEPSDITMSLASFSYPELEVVTNNFSKMVGKGGFGGVYEGTLLDGKKVAVKKLESNSQGLQEFKSEIETLGKIHHVHLVELLGFCAEGPHKLLVYEFMPNGSLEKWIFSDDFILDWRNRMRILLGTAQGLAYLHEECEPKRLHLDVKPQNILLDDSFNAKVSDFGLCRLLPGDQTSILLTRMMGTIGYLPPEWVNGIVSEKHDVYSFGIVMLETLSGRKSTATIALDGDCLHFLEWVMMSMENGTLIDHRLLMHEGYTEEQSRRVTEIALLCIDEDANMRPSMKTVVKLLEDIDDALTQLHGVGQVNVQNTVDEESALL